MRRLVAFLMIGAVALMSGCSADHGWENELSPAWTRTVSAVSDPLVLDDVVVAYVMGGDRGTPGAEFLTAWRLDDGEVLWSLEATPGNGHTRAAHSVAALEVDDEWFVAFLAPRRDHPPSNFDADFRVVAAETGEAADAELQVRAVAAQRPTRCQEKDAFCLTGIVEGDVAEHDQTFSYAPGASELAPELSEGAPDIGGAAYIGSGISLTDEDWVRYGTDGKLNWTRSFAGIFGPEASSYAGFAWNEPTDEKAPLVGAGRGWYPFGDPGAYTQPLTDGRAVGLDRESGKTIWTVDGAQPCVGFDGRLVVDEGIVVLCDFRSGSVTSEWTGEEVTNVRYDDVDLDIVGVDISSGEKVWTVALESDARNGAVPWDDGPDLIWGESLIVTIDGRAHTIDPRTGTTAPIASEAVLLCSSPKREVMLDHAGSETEYSAAAGMRYCSTTGEVVPEGSLSEGTIDLLGVEPDQPIAMLIDGAISVYLARK